MTTDDKARTLSSHLTYSCPTNILVDFPWSARNYLKKSKEIYCKDKDSCGINMKKRTVNDEYFLTIAVAEAQQAWQTGNAPVGAVVTNAEGRVLAQNHNLWFPVNFCA